MSKCTECNEYDKEKHYCPKFCDVIKNTVDDIRADERAKIINGLAEAVKADELAQMHGNMFTHYVDDFWKNLEQDTSTNKN